MNKILTNNPYISRSFWLIVSQIFVSAVAVLSTVFLSNYTTPEIFGTYKFLMAMAVILSVFSLTGMTTAITQAVARGFEGNFRESVLVQLRWSVLTLLLGGGLALWYWHLGDKQLVILIIFIAIISPISSALNTYKGIFVGRDDFRLTALYSALNSIIPFLFLILAISVHGGIGVIILAYFVGNLGINLFFYGYTVKFYGLNTKSDQETILYGKKLSLAGGISILSQYLDSFIVYNFFGPQMMAIYALALAGPEQIRNSLRFVSTLALPSFSRWGLFHVKARLSLIVGLYSLVLISLAGIYITFSSAIFHLFFRNYLSALPLVPIAAFLILGALLDLIETLMSAQKMFRPMLSLGISRSLIRISLMIVGGLFAGMIGLLTARLASLLISLFWGYGLILRQKEKEKEKFAAGDLPKITYISKLRMPEERGISFANAAECRAFAKLGYDLELVLPDRRQIKNLEGIDFWNYYQVKRNLFRIIKLDCIDLPQIPLVEKIVYHFRYLVISWSFCASAIIYLIKQKRKAVYVCNDSKEMLFTLAIVKLFYRPLVIYEVHILPGQAYDSFLEAVGLKAVTVLVSTTHRFKRHYLKNGFPKNRIIVYPNGINLEDYDYRTPKSVLRKTLGLPVDKIILGFGGRFVTARMEKGIPELIKAAASPILKKHNVFVVCIGGPQEYVDKYKELARSLGIENYCTILGHVPPNKLYEYMRSFDICIMPFPWTKHFAFNMSPLKMFEYMASKRPLVATNLPVIKEILTHRVNSYLVKPGDVNSLAKGIREIITNQNLSKKISDQAFKEVKEKYLWKKRQKAIMDVLFDYEVSGHSFAN